jgi:hypothetical protein
MRRRRQLHRQRLHLVQQALRLHHKSRRLLPKRLRLPGWQGLKRLPSLRLPRLVLLQQQVLLV